VHRHHTPYPSQSIILDRLRARLSLLFTAPPTVARRPLPPPSTHRCPEVDARSTRRGDRSSTHAARGATLEGVGGVSLYAARLGGRDALEKSGYFFPCEPPVVHYIICLNATLEAV